MSPFSSTAAASNGSMSSSSHHHRNRHQIPQRSRTLSSSHSSQIIHLIPHLLSPNNQLRKDAETTLKELSYANNYLCCLLQIVCGVSDEEILARQQEAHASGRPPQQQLPPSQTRHFCSIEFKNSIEKYWRKHAPHAVTQEEKSLIRSQLLTSLMQFHLKGNDASSSMTCRQIFNLMSFSVAAIARIDYPNDWPSLIEALIGFINSDDDDVRLKALLVLKDVVKQLATKKLLDSKKHFRKLASQLMPFVKQIWEYYMNKDYALLQEYISQQNDDSTFVHRMEPAFRGTEACISIVASLTDHGMRSLDDDTIALLQGLYTHTVKLYSFFEECKKRGMHNRITAMVVRCVRKFLRPIIAIIPRHPLDFVPLLEQYIQFAIRLLLQNEPEYQNPVEPKYHALLVRCMTIIKVIFITPAYMNTSTGGGTTSADAKLVQAKHIIHEKCFTLQTIGTIMDTLISKYMLLSPEEVELWDTNPEEFLKDQDSDWDGTLKSTADTLYMTVMDTYEEECSESMVKLLNHFFNKSRNTSNKHDCLLRESTYGALGWASYYLHSHLNFKQIFTSQLDPEARDPSTNRLVRRRIIWAIGRWAEQMDSDTRVASFKLLEQLLEQHQNDVVTQLSVFFSLSDIVDDYNFQPSEFEPFMNPFISHIFKLLSQQHMEDSQLKLLRFLTSLVCKMKTCGNQYVSSIMQQLGSLWQSSNSYLIQTVIVSLTHELVQTIPPESWTQSSMLNFIVHLIRSGIDPSQLGFVYYCEESLDLYRGALTQCEMHGKAYAAAVSEAFIPLVEYLFLSLNQSSEYIVQSLAIISHHITLDAQAFLNRYAKQVSELVNSIVGNFKSTTLHQMSICLDEIMSRFPQQSIPLFHNALCKILQSLLGKKEESMVNAQYVCITSRLLLSSQEQFLRILGEALGDDKQQVSRAFAEYVSIAADNADSIWTLHHRNIVALSLLSCYPTNDADLLRLFVSKLLPLCASVYEDAQIPQLSEEGGENADTPLSPEDQKIARVNLSEVVKQTLQRLQNQLGNENFQQLMSNVDRTVFQRLEINMG